MLDIYAKGEADDLSAADRKVLSTLASELKRAAKEGGQGD